MSFSRKQQSHYRPLVKKAWAATCARAGQSPNNKGAFEVWYRDQLMDSMQVYTTKELNQADDFDRLMGHFAEIAGDEYWIDRLSRGKERRMIHLIKGKLKDLDTADPGNKHTWAYAMSIYDHMHLPAQIEECPAQLLWKVYQALDTHVRRLNSQPADVPF